MATARSEVVTEGVEAVYHCISRCVRRAFLCGTDTYSSQSYEHRKDWIILRIKELAADAEWKFPRRPIPQHRSMWSR